MLSFFKNNKLKNSKSFLLSPFNLEDTQVFKFNSLLSSSDFQTFQTILTELKYPIRIVGDRKLKEKELLNLGIENAPEHAKEYFKIYSKMLKENLPFNQRYYRDYYLIVHKDNTNEVIAEFNSIGYIFTCIDSVTFKDYLDKQDIEIFKMLYGLNEENLFITQHKNI